MADGDDGGDLPEIELIPVESARGRPPRRTRRGLGRLLIVGVAGLLIGGLVLVTDDRGDPAPDPEDEEEDAEDGTLPQPVALRPLGPRDGKASVGLPVTVEPAVGLEDGSRVTATGSGFVPSEQVAIVQCAIEAGRPARGGEAAGVDGCDTSRVEYANASSDGVATGEFSLSITITTPVTGTVDCSTGPERCILAMAAMTDYDRSGAGGLTFGPAPPVPPDVPTLIVEPSVGLADAEVVHVTATGLAASTMVELAVCSIDPRPAGRPHPPTPPTSCRRMAMAPWPRTCRSGASSRGRSPVPTWTARSACATSRSRSTDPTPSRSTRA